MAIIPHVKPGDPFKPNAALSNAVRDLVNGSQHHSARENLSDFFGSVRIHVWNSGDTAIEPYTFVTPDLEAEMIFQPKPETESESETTDSQETEAEYSATFAVPVTRSAEDDPEIFMFSTAPIAPNSYGECVVRGPVMVETDDAEGDFAIPVLGTHSVTISASEGYPVIFRSGKKAVIDLSFRTKGQKYTGSFPVTFNADTETLKVGDGFLSRNGKIELISGAEGIAPANGWLCVCSHIDEESGGWTDPEFEILELDDIGETTYPIAEITDVPESDDEDGEENEDEEDASDADNDDEDGEENEDEEDASDADNDDENEEEEKITCTIRQLPIAVAVIIETAPCPLIKTEESENG